MKIAVIRKTLFNNYPFIHIKFCWKLNISACSHLEKLISIYFETILHTEFSKGYEIFIFFYSRLTSNIIYLTQYSMRELSPMMDSRDDPRDLLPSGILKMVEYCLSLKVPVPDWKSSIFSNHFYLDQSQFMHMSEMHIFSSCLKLNI